MMSLTLFFLLNLLPAIQPGRTIDDAITLYETGEYRQAIELLLQLRGASPNDPGVRLWLGKSYLKTRDWDGAVREIEKATQLQPSDAHYYLWLGRACGARAEHSFPLLAPRWARRVVKEFETARKLAPKDLNIRFDLLDFYLEAPGFLGGGKDKANAEAQDISKLNPQKGYIARSTVLSKDKKWDMAKRELVQATMDFPNDANAFKDLAEFLLERQDYNGAFQYAGKAVAIDNQSKGSLLTMAAASIHLRTELDNSEKILNNLASGPLTDSDPAFEEVYYWLGKCYLAKGEKAKADTAFKTALSFNPDYEKAREPLQSR